MPYLNDELREWIAAQLATLGVDEIAIYAVDPQRGQDEERRVLVATEVGLIDGWYAPRGGSSARYGFTARLWPWQAVRGVDLRSETYRVWALEHRTRWWLRLARPAFESETDAPELGAALCDFAKVCAVMAEPAGWQAVQEEVPARREGGLRVVPAPTELPPEAGTDVEAVAPTGRPLVPPPVIAAMTSPAQPQPIQAAEPPAELEAVRGEGDEGASDEPEPEPEPDLLDEATTEREPEEPDAAATDGEPAVEQPEEPPPDDHAAAQTDGQTPTAADLSEEGHGPRLPSMLGPLATRREARAREREQRAEREARAEREREQRAEREGLDREERADHEAEAAASPVAVAVNVWEPADEEPAADPQAAPAPELPPGEEPINLDAYLPGEEPINLDDYDPDPLGLDGPTRRR
ncbi:MAG TPA: hypothetical protein VFM19_02685 [Candidatus Limnocylindria bacterium]|nr:hypothetical protein [Candidatus Limnocylindria bacterium]